MKSVLGTILKANLLMGRAKIASLQGQSRLMLAVIWLFVGGYLVFGFELFYQGLTYVNAIPGFGPGLLDRLLYIFFAVLLMMLFFSNVIIGYATLFRNQETLWLLGLPVAFADILRWKWLETMILASWAFVFLSMPVLLAFGMVRGVPWTFYALAPVLYVPFLMIPAAAASLVTLLLARFVPRRAFKVIVIGGAIILLTSALSPLLLSRRAANDGTQIGRQFDRIMSQTKFAEHPFWPSAWMVKSLLGDETDRYGHGHMINLCVLASNALLLGLFVYSASGKLFYSAWSRTQGFGETPLGLFSGVGPAFYDALAWSLNRVPGLSLPMRSLIMKDIKTFFRDTVQWSQFTIFFGLLGIYVVNLRHFAEGISMPIWSNLVSFLNLVACTMTLATLTTRFVFPQFSLEGKRLWIVGMAPLGLRKVLMEKFWLSSLGGIGITLTLMLVSSLMLKLNVILILMFCSTVIMMGFGLSGLAVGLGALYPNFKDDNPSKIVSGFGGTFCLVLSMTYVTACVGIEALGIQYYLTHRPSEEALGNLDPVLFGLHMIAPIALVLLISIGMVFVPLQLAFYKLKDLEI